MANSGRIERTDKTSACDPKQTFTRFQILARIRRWVRRSVSELVEKLMIFLVIPAWLNWSLATENMIDHFFSNLGRVEAVAFDQITKLIDDGVGVLGKLDILKRIRV